MASQYCTHRRLLSQIHHDNVHPLTADVSIHRDPLVMVRTPRPKSQATKTRRTSTWIHLVMRRVLSCREDQSGRALGCSYSVPNFVEVLSLLYDPNQPRVLEGTQHLEGEMASVAFYFDNCMQPARSHRPKTRTSCRTDSAEQSKDMITANSRFTEPRTSVLPKVPRRHSCPVYRHRSLHFLEHRDLSYYFHMDAHVSIGN